VKLDHLPAPRPPVQPVDVLGDQGEAGAPALELCEREVAGVWSRLRHELAAPFVPLPDQAGIPVERLRGCELLRVVALPEPGLGLAEGRHSALGGDAGARQRDDVVRAAERFAESFDQGRRQRRHAR
jgi:hypothetical protein